MDTRSPQVLNRRDLGPDWQPDENTVLVDRTTPYGNQFVVGHHGNRDSCVIQHAAWIMAPEQADLREQIVKELRGRDLVCWCAPKPCHADVLLELANDGELRH